MSASIRQEGDKAILTITIPGGGGGDTEYVLEAEYTLDELKAFLALGPVGEEEEQRRREITQEFLRDAARQTTQEGGALTLVTRDGSSGELRRVGRVREIRKTE